jgi:hypothetical protein
MLVWCKSNDSRIRIAVKLYAKVGSITLVDIGVSVVELGGSVVLKTGLSTSLMIFTNGEFQLTRLIGGSVK